MKEIWRSLVRVVGLPLAGPVLASLLVLQACGAPSPRPATATHDEALDLLATWLAVAGFGDGAVDYSYRELTADDPPRVVSTRDTATALRICGDATLRVVDGGYDVELSVQVIREDGRLAWGQRRLTFRGAAGELAIRTDELRVEGERQLPEGPRPRPFHGVHCGGGLETRETDCVVLSFDDEPPRRLAWPSPRR